MAEKTEAEIAAEAATEGAAPVAAPVDNGVDSELTAMFAEFSAAKEPASKPADVVDEAELAKLDGQEPAEPEEPAAPAAGDEGQKPEPVASAEPAPAVPAAAPAAEPAPTPADPWSSAPAELRAERDRLQHELNSEKGRTAPLNRRVTQLLQEKAALEDEVKKLRPPTPATPAASGSAPKAAPAPRERSERLKAAIEGYSEVAEPLVEELDGLRAETENLKAELAALTDERREIKLQQNERDLGKLHPDWKAVTARPDFGPWLSDQPDDIQSMAARNGERIVNVREAARLVRIFKQDLGITDSAPTPSPAPSPAPAQAQAQPNPPSPAPAAAAAPAAPANIADRRERQLSSSRSAPARSPGGPSQPPADDVNALFNHYAARKERKQA